MIQTNEESHRATVSPDYATADVPFARENLAQDVLVTPLQLLVPDEA